MDREKVIKGLEVCFDSSRECNGCPYIATPYCKTTLRNDVTALLKEQEAVEPKTGHWVSVNDGDVVTIDNDGFPERACFCSECKKYLIASDEYAVYGKYCPFCGAKMEGSK